MQTNDHITLASFHLKTCRLQKELGIFCRSFSADLYRTFPVQAIPGNQFSQYSFQILNLLQEIIDSSKTDYFIQGTFRCEKEMVRINVQLYNNDTRHLCGATGSKEN